MAVVSIGIVAYVLNIWINWTVLEHMYAVKAGLNWFDVIFYHGFTFYVAAALALIVVNPVPGGSDLFSMFATLSVKLRSMNLGFADRYQDFRFFSGSQSAPSSQPEKFRLPLRLWAAWQVVKYVVAFFVIVGLGGLPFFGNLVMPVLMATQGYGSWALVPRILGLPTSFASSSQLITLMPTMQVQYFIVYAIAAGVLTVVAVRLFLRFAKDFATQSGNGWIRDAILIFSCVLAISILGASYWGMNAETPYAYGILWTLFAATILGWFYFRLSGKGLIPISGTRRRVVMVASLLLVAVLVVNIGASVFIYFNWNNRWPTYEWTPLIQKQIGVTDWASGVQNLTIRPLSDLPQGNTSNTLSLVRQWGQSQAYDTMTKEIGAYNWMAPASSQIVFVNNTEYWVAPTTIIYPTTNWINSHLIYTHSDRMMVINTHSGKQVTAQQALGAPDPLIYYGEGPSFSNNVYVHIGGYNEIANQSYPGQPDYTLSGFERMLWFSLRGQMGFAFSPPQNSIDMLFNRNILNRVGDVLINGLQVDPQAYIVTNGTQLFYAVQVYISYPMNSGFSASPYLRFFGVVLVNPTDGSMVGYTVPNQNYSDSFLMNFYENYYHWQPAPAWLVPQLRYPNALMGEQGIAGQLTYNFFYHVTDPYVWRSGSGFYTAPPDAAGNPSPVLYLTYTVGNRSSFVALQEVEYQNSASKNLAGIYIVDGGSKLGQMYLYQTPSNITSTLVGPSAALQALNINPQVRTQLTLLPNYQIGNTLLYIINGQLFYFVPVYTNPGQSAVIVQMPFVAAINPYSGNVSIGGSAAKAYYSLLGQQTPVTPATTNVSTAYLMRNVTSLFQHNGLRVLNATRVGANAWVPVGNVTYSSPASWPGVSATLSSFVNSYAAPFNASIVLALPAGNNSYYYGILVPEQSTQQPSSTILVFYYMEVRY
ncbi:MAG: hypothetical protein JRN39_04605 [Nitrososphaerota archaeon]|nr:hypothetical protein [Nitrososphaerota archaeon]